MTSLLNAQHIRPFDYPRFAKPFRDCIRANAERLAESADAKIEYIAKAHIRKEEVVAAVIKLEAISFEGGRPRCCVANPSSNWNVSRKLATRPR